jgi:hypothetical protein
MLHSPKLMGQMRRPSEETPEVPVQQHTGKNNTPAPSQQEAPEMVNPAMQRVTDHAKNILSNPLSVHGGFTMEDAASAWDSYYSARSADELAKKLAPMNLPNETKHQLMVAFQQHREIAKPKTLKDRIDNAVAVIHRVAQLHKTSAPEGGSALDKAERHPVVMGELAKAAMKEREKEK